MKACMKGVGWCPLWQRCPLCKESEVYSGMGEKKYFEVAWSY